MGWRRSMAQHICMGRSRSVGVAPLVRCKTILLVELANQMLHFVSNSRKMERNLISLREQPDRYSKWCDQSLSFGRLQANYPSAPLPIPSPGNPRLFKGKLGTYPKCLVEKKKKISYQKIPQSIRLNNRK